MSLGKTIRLKRVLNEPTNTSVICALDHGMTSPVFLEPLADIRARVTEAVTGGANVLMLSRGMSRIAAAELSQTTAVAYMLSASADPGENPSIAAVAEVEEALRSGADAVVLYVALGTDTEQDMIERLAEVGSACDELGMPFIAEAEWPSAYSGTTAELGTDYLLRNVRLCAELGADVIKTNWPGSGEEYARLVAAAAGLPTVLAGGSRITETELLTRQQHAMEAGAVGCSVGRNIFMHENPEAMTRALKRVIVDRWTAERALEELGGGHRRSMTDAALVCGIDVGSQGSCLAVFDAGGDRLATSYQPHTLSYPRPGWAEQDPRDWRAAVVNGFRDLSARVNLRRVRAVSFGSQLDGLVCVDRNGQPAGPAIIWMDRRADPLCRAAEQRIGPDEWYARSGCNLDGSHVAAKIAWVARERPDQDARTDRYLLPGAYMVRVACDADVVDRSNASSTMALDPDTGTWDERLLAAFDIDPARLPPVVGADEPVGEITPGFAADTGLPPETTVVCGCGDEMAATLGAGLVEPGMICDVLGTAEPVCAVADRPLRDRTQIAECHPHAAPGRWLLESPGWASGASYRWFRDQLGGGLDYEGLNALAAEAPAGADGLVFLPWMGGAMAPRWEADARGGWYGLTPAHGRAHMARALLEGSAYALRDVVEAITDAGLEPSRIVCVAGGARSPLVRQMRADATGVPVTWSEDVETTARGAAMLAAAGSGVHESTAAAAGAMSRIATTTHEPDAAGAEASAEGHRRYRVIFDALADRFGELA